MPVSSSPAEPLPAEVEQAAAAHGMGRLVSVHKIRKRSWVLWVLCVLVGVALSVILIGIWMLWTLFAQHPHANPQVRRVRYYLFERGLIVGDGRGGYSVYPFNSVAAVYQKITQVSYAGVRGTRGHVYTLLLNGGGKARFTSFVEQVGPLGAAVNAGVSQALRPAARAALTAGQPISFERFTLEPAGVRTGRKLIEWPAISGLAFANGFARLSLRTGRPVSLGAVAEIPNLPLLHSLIAEESQRAAAAAISGAQR